MSTQAQAPVQASWAVIDGPGLDRLMDAFKYAFDDAFHCRVVFQLVSPDNSRLQAEVRVIGIAYESGSSGRFAMTVSSIFGKGEMYYDAHARKGTLTHLP